MKLIEKASFLVAILFLSAFSIHKYYISFTKINYIENSKALQITSRIFIDDLENALNKQFGINSKLHTGKETTNIDSYISKYITDKFYVLINDVKKDYNFLGKEYDEDEIVLYLEIEGITEIKTIEVKNKILMETFNDQQNIIKLNINGKKKSFILTYDSDKDLLKF